MISMYQGSIRCALLSAGPQHSSKTIALGRVKSNQVTEAPEPGREPQLGCRKEQGPLCPQPFPPSQGVVPLKKEEERPQSPLLATD